MNNHKQKVKNLQDYLIDHPDDDESWLVLGDILQEEGNPRGELISLYHKDPGGDEYLSFIERNKESLIDKFLLMNEIEYCFKWGYLYSLSAKEVSYSSLEEIIKSEHTLFLKHLIIDNCDVPRKSKMIFLHQIRKKRLESCKIGKSHPHNCFYCNRTYDNIFLSQQSRSNLHLCNMCFNWLVSYSFDDYLKQSTLLS